MNLLFSHTIKEFEEISVVVDLLKPLLKPRTLILLDGDLGAGKTTLIRELLKSTGYDHATSPTYALHHHYSVQIENEDISVEHLDLYRLENEDQIESSGFWDLFQAGSQSVIFVEWANRISIDDWPLDWNRYRLQILKNNFNERSYQFYNF